MLICLTISHQCPGETVESTEGNYDGPQSQEAEAKFSATTHPRGNAAASNTSPGTVLLAGGGFSQQETRL